MEVLTLTEKNKKMARRRRSLLIPRIGLFLMVALTLLESSAAHARSVKIEAAFLYNFLNYIEWPDFKEPDPTEEAIICIYNDKALEEALRYVQAHKAQERSLTILDMKASDPPSACHMAFISRVNTTQDVASLSSKSPGVLLVGNSPRFVDRGGMIELVEEEERITFNINNSVLMRAGFKVSSRLLSIAREVK